jgi:hypothetical protein
MDSILGAIVLRDRLVDSTTDEATASVPPEAPALYHWVAVAPSEGHAAIPEPLDVSPVEHEPKRWVRLHLRTMGRRRNPR